MTFIDSNVWLYAVTDEPNNGKRETAIQILKGSDTCISSQVVNEVLANILKDKIGTDEFVSQLLERMYADYIVLEILHEDIRTAMQLRREYRFSYWDSVIVATALRANADTLYSEDMQDGLRVRNQLSIKNPFR